MGNTVLNYFVFRPHPPSYAKNNANLHFIKTKHGSVICGFYLNNNADITILFSHGNAEDIGDNVDYYNNYSKSIKVNMFIYDYSGYGHSTGYPSEEHVYNDVEAVYDHMTNSLSIPPGSIIAYGRSLGSTASVHIATKKKIKGLILQCPIASIHRVKFRLKYTLPYDFFCNIDKISTIECPILFIHGTNDTLIPYHGTVDMIMRTKVNTYYALIEGAGHNNLESCYFKQLNTSIVAFIYILKANIRESVRASYDITKLNLHELRKKYILSKDPAQMKLKGIMNKIQKSNHEIKSENKRDPSLCRINLNPSQASDSEHNDNIFKKYQESSIETKSYPSVTSISTIFDTDGSTTGGIPDKTFSENNNNMSLENISGYLYNNIPIKNLYKNRRWEENIIKNSNRNNKLEIDKNEIKEGYRNYLYGKCDTDVKNFNNNNSYKCTKLGSLNQNTKDRNFIGGSNTSKSGSNTSKSGSNTSKSGSDTSKIGSNTSKIGSNTSKIGSNTSKIGSNTSKIGSNTSKIGSNTSKIESNTSKIGSQIKSDNGKNKIIYDTSGKLDGNSNTIASKKGEKNGSSSYIYNPKKNINTKSNLKSDNKQGLEKLLSNGASGSMSSTKREELSSREGIANFCNIKSESNISSNVSATSDKKIVAKKGNKSRNNSHERGGSNSSGNISGNDAVKSDASKCYLNDKVGNNKIEINKLKGKIQVNNNNISKYYETSNSETNFFDIPQENNALESSN
ncbi:alpha/beta hydrolase, putative [Plasmodium vinckei vinckei]|uniref:Alpha/beta hydrolase, putative n=1 Tax=Plasmodium vinckei vinckei TaxID=54757 RepID=A0A449BR75_PLAVN|nr:alpha/beta hydrolase, putative [Plasmodium vinckei vinckei]VEV55859.1 alpha/beta hydrolase, putative [Plasmodium vinckei vinckei]